MRAVRLLVALSLTAGVVTVVACQEPTQVTIDVRLATATCPEIHGTAINVGVSPDDTETKVRSKFPNAQTTDCDGATSRIGTLVVTPSEDGDRGSVIVITSYGTQKDPTECQPENKYKDCIVARRAFSFSEHRRLVLPITIDPTCVNVPCDAFSTCRKGSCFPSDADPCEAGAKCLEPGETESGGTDHDAAVPPDTGTPVTKPVASCDGAVLKCGDAPCGPGLQCCNTAAGAICQPACGMQLCCSTLDCGGRTCLPLDGLSAKGGADAEADAGGPPMVDAGQSFDDGAADTLTPPPDVNQPPADADPPDGDTGDATTPPPDSGSDASTPADSGTGLTPGLGICQ